jgi:2-polyprenyl-3-methyl-5-hydroxy-6-metoxy-1,4-benzoquinol methylase
MQLAANPWDEHAEAFAQWATKREQAGVAGNAITVCLLELLGDVARREVLDACCGDGFLARLLAARGAQVTGLDLSPRLIQLARERDPQGNIKYQVADLSRPLPEMAEHFDLIGSYLALNDVADHRGFAATLATLIKTGGRAVLAFNNPYSSVVREHISDYFEHGAHGVYGGMSAAMGTTVYFYHRTLEEYLDAFLVAGFRLAKLADVPERPGVPWALPSIRRFPRFMVLAFNKPAG